MKQGWPGQGFSSFRLGGQGRPVAEGDTSTDLHKTVLFYNRTEIRKERNTFDYAEI